MDKLHQPAHEFSDADIETLLSSLPKHKISARGDAMFYSALKQRVREQVQETRRRWFTLPQFTFATSFAVVLFVFSGTLYSYQDSVTRGDLLYPWKRAGESVELVAARSPSSQVDTHVRFADRRMREAESIVGHPITGVSFIPRAMAATRSVDTVNLDSRSALNLALTLQDMRTSMTEAAHLLESSDLTPLKIQTGLVKLKEATQRHIENLAAIEKKTSVLDVSEVVRQITVEEQDTYTKVIQAQTVVQDGIARQEKRLVIRVTADPAETAIRHEQARTTYAQALELIKTLPAEKRKPLEEQITAAKQALDDGHLGLSIGVTRSVQRHIIIDQGKPQVIYGVPNPSEAGASLRAITPAEAGEPAISRPPSTPLPTGIPAGVIAVPTSLPPATVVPTPIPNPTAPSLSPTPSTTLPSGVIAVPRS